MVEIDIQFFGVDRTERLIRGEVWENFFYGMGGGEAMFLPEDFGASVFDEFIGPADALDGSANDIVVEEFDDGKSEAVVEDVIFESANDFGILGVL